MLEYSVIIASIVLFLYACTWEGMILQKVPVLLWNAPVWIKKPLFSCPICMTPWWGSLVMVAFGLTTGYWPHWFVWMVQLLVAGGINVVLSSFVKPDPDDSYPGSDHF